MFDWLFTDEQIQNSPSRRAGMAAANEVEARQLGVKLILDVGVKLKWTANLTIATAAVYYHRFYMCHSFQDFPNYLTALGCLFLAGKVEETPKKCRDIAALANASYSAFLPYQNLIEEIMAMERVLLQTIKFELHVEHPYRFLVRYAKVFEMDKAKSSEILQTAWTFVNDSHMSTMCIEWEPQVIAIILLNLSLRVHKVERLSWRNRSSDQEYWWSQFVLQLPASAVNAAGDKVLESYRSSANAQR